jgi:hypothetical protein
MAKFERARQWESSRATKLSNRRFLVALYYLLLAEARLSSVNSPGALTTCYAPRTRRLPLKSQTSIDEPWFLDVIAT